MLKVWKSEKWRLCISFNPSTQNY